MQEHYGCRVQTNIAMDILRSDQCLCFNCTGKIFDADEMQEYNCHIRQALYQTCKEENIALMVTRCPHFYSNKDEDEGLCGRNG